LRKRIFLDEALEKFKILIVDDEPSLCEIFSELLIGKG
jgi:CheY-like chemotaxis protein